MQVTASLEPAYRCESCDRIHEVAECQDAGPLYECGECGTIFNRANSANDNHQCPDCNKFATKLTEVSCPEECSEELEEVEVIVYEGTIYVPNPE